MDANETAGDGRSATATGRRVAVLAALDALALALADHDHAWTAAEREMYERAIAILTEDTD